MSFVFADRPQRIYWEITRACDLACRHCRAAAVAQSSPDELSTRECAEVLANLRAFGDPLPHLVFTGGDPLKRADLFDLIAAAQRQGFAVSVAPSATPLLTSSAIESLRDAGVEAISLSLDGSAAERHDAIRGIPGTYDRTLEAARAAFACGLPFQVNTLVCGETVDDLPAIYETVVARGAARWSLFFLVSVGRGHVLAPISSSQAERVLTWAAALNTSPDLHRPIVTTTEAPHFRRVTAERRRERPAAAASPAASPHGRRGGGIRDGNGIMFISHTGQITPSGFLEVPCGNVRRDNVIEVYQRSELFVQLREPTAFGGRCGRCAFQWICGGSRARAFAATGDPLAEDPLCDYQPAHAPRSRMAMA